MLAALALRVGYVLGWKNPAPILGDAFYYHYGANLFADGHGFPDPYAWKLTGAFEPKALHPPLYIVVLGLGSLVGLRSYLDHQLISCLLGAGTVFVVGLAGRRIAGPAVGLLAAGICAVYPMLWLNDALVLSESLSTLCAAGVVLAAHRFWERRGLLDAVVLGAAVALAALARAELLLLAVVLVLPLVLRRGARAWPRRIGLLAVAGAACVAVLAPWALYNVARFDRPAVLGTSLGATLRVANCPSTYAGPFKGWWDYTCIISRPTPPGDASVQDEEYRRQALDFMRERRDEVPGVVAARVGRVWAAYRPLEQLMLDTAETRELPASRVGLAMYYVLVVGAVAGAVVLVRRRVPVLPLLAPLVVVTISAAAFYGTTRFRASAEPSIVLLASVAIVALVGEGRRTERGAGRVSWRATTVASSVRPRLGLRRAAAAGRAAIEAAHLAIGTRVPAAGGITRRGDGAHTELVRIVERHRLADGTVDARAASTRRVRWRAAAGDWCADDLVAELAAAGTVRAIEAALSTWLRQCTVAAELAAEDLPSRLGPAYLVRRARAAAHGRSGRPARRAPLRQARAGGIGRVWARAEGDALLARVARAVAERARAAARRARRDAAAAEIEQRERAHAVAGARAAARRVRSGLAWTCGRAAVERDVRAVLHRRRRRVRGDEDAVPGILPNGRSVEERAIAQRARRDADPHRAQGLSKVEVHAVLQQDLEDLGARHVDPLRRRDSRGGRGILELVARRRPRFRRPPRVARAGRNVERVRRLIRQQEVHGHAGKRRVVGAADRRNEEARVAREKDEGLLAVALLQLEPERIDRAVRGVRDRRATEKTQKDATDKRASAHLVSRGRPSRTRGSPVKPFLAAPSGG